eukprot:NODE_2780_length_876_cov_192.643118.p2 GENE.NODE_2780_length_876_cov_192.643118~~NODE_2780_length_876_cov_192.643118.p2  ORF type:complete len:202 (+),score=70.44 NODE_2780_length_876_cov_192.643118:105-710(+)
MFGQFFTPGIEEEEGDEDEGSDGEGSGGLAQSALAGFAGYADQATEASVKQIVALRKLLHPTGYEMRSLELKMGLIPRLEVFFKIRPGASMALSFVDQELTHLQGVVIQMLEQKTYLDSLVARNGMIFKSLRVILTVPPAVAVKMGFKKREPAAADAAKDAIAAAAGGSGTAPAAGASPEGDDGDNGDDDSDIAHNDSAWL